VLYLSKIEARRLELESLPFDLHAMVSEALKPLAQRAEEKGLAFEQVIDPELPKRVVSDPLRLRQLLVNIAGNAVKFTTEGKVRVEARKLEAGAGRGGPMLEVIVADTGIGIPRELQSRVFEAFTQADQSTTRRFGGTGLGLTICRQLTELMNGRIWVESEDGAGSEFHFTLPLVEGPVGVGEEAEGRKAAWPPSGPAEPARTLRVLLVDDNAVNRKVFVHLVGRMGHDVATAENGRHAIDIVEREAFDVIFMDVQMPEMDGLEATRLIRAREQARAVHVPICALTAHAMRGDEKRCIEAGMDAYLTKPVRPRELEEMLSRLSVAGAP
jgi:CheY-like chemotaxis protein